MTARLPGVRYGYESHCDDAAPGRLGTQVWSTRLGRRASIRSVPCACVVASIATTAETCPDTRRRYVCWHSAAVSVAHGRTPGPRRRSLERGMIASWPSLLGAEPGRNLEP